MLSTKRTPLFRLLQWLYPSENSALLAIAITVGLSTGLIVWLYRVGIAVFHDLFIARPQQLLGENLGKLATVIGLAAAGLLVGWLMNHFVGHEKHHGVAGIMESVAMGGGRLRYRVMPIKVLSSAISLGAGASVGPEDPSVQVGANIGSMVGQRLHLKEDRLRLLVAAGAASGISAAFAAPIAGVFFALEVVLLEFTTSAFGVVVLASVVATVVTQALEQTQIIHEPALDLLNYTLGTPAEFPLFALLGLLLAPIAASIIRSVYWQHDMWEKHIHWPRPIQTAVVGAVVGAVGIFLPQILGTGREVMNEVLAHPAEYTILLLFVLGIAKILMTGLSLAGGFVGGVFAPSLFIGLMLGGMFGRILQVFHGEGVISDPQAYAIVGMAAMMAGVVRSPITAIMLVFEMTNDYRLIMPIMLAAVVCIYLANRFAPLGMYQLGLARQGIHIREGRDVDLMQGVLVSEVMDEPITIGPDASIQELEEALRHHHVRSICVADSSGNLLGIVTLSDLESLLDEHPDQVPTMKVRDIATQKIITVHPDDVLWRAIRLMGAHEVGRLPVVDERTNQLVGMLSRHDIVEAYNKAIARKLHDQHNADQVRLSHLTGAHVLEINIIEDAPIAGKRIQDIRWPPECVVASIRRQNKLLVPHGSTDLRAGDQLTVVAAPECEGDLKNLFGQSPVTV